MPVGGGGWSGGGSGIFKEDMSNMEEYGGGGGESKMNTALGSSTSWVAGSNAGQGSVIITKL